MDISGHFKKLHEKLVKNVLKTNLDALEQTLLKEAHTDQLLLSKLKNVLETHEVSLFLHKNCLCDVELKENIESHMLSMIRYDVVVKVFSKQSTQESTKSMPLNVFYRRYVQESMNLAWKIMSHSHGAHRGQMKMHCGLLH